MLDVLSYVAIVVGIPATIAFFCWAAVPGPKDWL